VIVSDGERDIDIRERKRKKGREKWGLAWEGEDRGGQGR